MSLSDPNAASDREIWVASCDMGVPRSENCPSALDLASYADGRLADDASKREPIEAHLSSCDACLDAVAAIRLAGQDETHAFASTEVMASARSLVSGAPAGERSTHPVLARIGRWGLAAAAAIAVSVTGYWLGLHSTPPPSPIKNGTVSDVSFGLFVTSDTDAELDDLLATLEDLSS